METNTNVELRETAAAKTQAEGAMGDGRMDVAGSHAKTPRLPNPISYPHLYTNCCFGDVALYQQRKGRSVSCTPGTVGTVYFVDVLVIFPASRTSDKLMN